MSHFMLKKQYMMKKKSLENSNYISEKNKNISDLTDLTDLSEKVVEEIEPKKTNILDIKIENEIKPLISEPLIIPPENNNNNINVCEINISDSEYSYMSYFSYYIPVSLSKWLYLSEDK